MTIRIIDRTKEKNCTKCEKTKPLEEFYRHPDSKDGRQPYCKECVRVVCHSHYQEHIDERRAHSRSYYREHADERIAYNCEYQRTTKKGKAILAAAQRRYRQSEKGRALQRAVRHRRRARLEEAEGNVTSLEIFMLLHNAEACAYCGRADVELTLEHVVPLSRGGSNSIDNLLAVCKSCNSSKCDQLLGEWLPWEWHGAPPEGSREKIDAIQDSS